MGERGGVESRASTRGLVTESCPTHQLMKKNSDRNGVRTWIEVDKKALAHNLRALRSLLSPKTKFMAVVKSNAYGHGLIDFSREIARGGADWLGVDSIVEATALRKAGIKKPILVLGYTLPEMLPVAANTGASITVSTFETLSEISKIRLAKKLKVHIKVDTGMHRQGFIENERAKLLKTLAQLKNKIVVEGLFTHFGAAKNPSFSARTQKQIEQFNIWREAFRGAGFKPIEHAAASGGAIIFPESHFDMVRIGAALYGLWPSKEVEAFAKRKLLLKPVLSWKTLIGEVKRVKAGERVGYDFTEKLKRNSALAICPIGYWHGFPRALSSVGEVLVRGKRARVVGRVSMDMITIDVTGISGAKVGDEVTIIGESGREKISVEDIAELSDTSSYEIITRINPLIKKIF